MINQAERALVRVLDGQNVDELLDRLRCPALFVFASGQTDADRQHFFPKRKRVADFVAANHPQIRIEWMATGHMIPFTAPAGAAALIKSFAIDRR